MVSEKKSQVKKPILKGSTHASRTLMIGDLQRLLSDPGGQHYTVQLLRDAVVDDNVLGKKTERTRLSSWKYLRSTYALDGEDFQDSAFLKLWHQSPQAQEQLALLRALPRDPVLQLSAQWIVELAEGQAVNWTDLANFLKARGVAYSEKTLRSTAQNLLSSWSQVGWLSGRVGKKRAGVSWHSAAITYLLYREFQTGSRGLALYDSDLAKTLGLSPELLDDLANEAGRRGYLDYKRIDDVLEITFPGITRDNA